MEQHLFYSTEIEGNLCTLPREESHHCVRVLRRTTGDTVRITDGMGHLFEGSLLNEDPKKTLVKLTHELEAEKRRTYRLHIAIAPTKNINRFEWFVEKATEIGIDEITPILCQHSERKSINTERLHKILVAAAKQSEKSLFPVLNEMIPLEVILKVSTEQQKFIAYLDQQNKATLKTKYSQDSDVLILIGPEGDFNREEVEMARETGFEIVSLGDYRLRTETAGLVACQSVALLNE